MTDYAEIRLREPAGERSFGSRITLGGEGADVVVPGAHQIALVIERREGEWIALAQTDSGVRFDGRPLVGSRELRAHDALAVGEAELTVADISRTLLKLAVHHLVGNATIAPVGEVAVLNLEGGDEDIEIRATAPLVPMPEAILSSSATGIAPPIRRRKRGYGLAAALIGVALLLAVWLGMRLSGGSVDKPPATNLASPVHIDTSGVAAAISIDGVDYGRAPGTISVSPGDRTLTLRSPRYLDYVTTLHISGHGETQNLKVALQSSWGALKIFTVPATAQVSVDGAPAVAPGVIALPSGVRRVQAIAPGLKTWESSVVIKAGETLAIGPITLGQPDAHLTVQSVPAGAEISVAGTYRGHTPLAVGLPAGVAHDVVATLPGYASWNRSVFAEPGKSIALEVRLQPVIARVTVQGEPAGADLVIDGVARGQTPRSLDLSAVEHRVEVRKEGFLPFIAAVLPARGLERVVRYQLTSADRAKALLESAPTIQTKSGYVLKLIPPGVFKMGSDRREQGRRPNEGFRQVTLQRPFYLGVMEVTNIEFRQFRSEHASGYLEKKSLDLDRQPVSQVTWDDAVEYCNWLSQREGLPPAYEHRDKQYRLIRPVTAGYRLPTEAEWEYAARRAGPEHILRFSWGDSLPVALRTGNLAGAEATGTVGAELAGYRDDYPVVAPVGKFDPNALGLHDIGGNLSEWTNDFYQSFVDAASVTDPLGPDQSGRHAIRGANWKSSTIAELRLAWRDSADEASPIVGFRIARYAE